MAKLPWAIDYRPQTVKDFLFQDDSHKALVTKFIEEQDMPHLLLSGHRGTGKTSLANVLKKELEIDEMDFLEVNASDENSVETIRTKIKNFVSTYANSVFKVVFLDEADYLTPSAQAVLRNMMESFAENARFILTCNKPHKIIPELKSRCQELKFAKLDKEQMVNRCAKILKKAEGYKVESDEDIEIIEKIVDACYPDFRKTINTLQQQFIDGKLVSADSEAETDEFKVELLDMMANGQWGKIRTFMAENTPDDQWEDVYRVMYEYIGELPPFSDNPLKLEDAIVVIADALHKHAIIADPEINFAACIVRLSRIAK